MELTKSAINSTARAEATNIYEAMCLDAAENVDANFVSIWRFDDTKSKVVCLFAVDIESGETSSGQELLRKDFPRYFGTILEETVICAPDACAHYQTSELT